MGKFASATTVAPPRTLASPIQATGPATTFEGGNGFARDAKSDLFLLAITNMVGEDTFYESATTRDSRFRDLIHTVTLADPDWVARFIPFLRNEMFMRSASVVLAVETAWVRLRPEFKGTTSTTTVRQIIDSAVSRADEPAEVLAYWIARFGRTVPSGVKRGLADAIQRTWNEYTAMKYDGNSQAWRLGDVLNVVHPAPKAQKTAALYRWLLDARGGNDTPAEVLAELPMIVQRKQVHAIPVDKRRDFLKSPDAAVQLKNAGMTWEDLSGWVGGKLDASFWEAVIPSMGYMALLRNLRNFDEASVSDEVADAVAARLADPAEVAKSKQFPYRFWSAYKNAPSLRWGQALEKALNASVANIPSFPGRTLIVIDTSGSMLSPVSNKSQITCVEAAAIFGLALAHKQGFQNVDVYGFGDGIFKHETKAGESLLKAIERFIKRVGEAGYGTNIPLALRQWGGQDRIGLFTDGQTMHGGRGGVPTNVPIYGFNLGGYGVAALESGKNNNYEFGGLNDRTFTMISMLEASKSTTWPF